VALIEQFIEKAKALNKKVVFPEGEDERILESAFQIKKEGIATPILLGEKEKILAASDKLNIDAGALEIIEVKKSPDLSKFASLYQEKRKNVSISVAERLVKRELVFGGMLVSAGKADAMVAGVSHATVSVIQSATLTIGLQEEISTASSFFIMVLPGEKILFYADCGVNIDPNSEQLAEIGICTADNYKKIMNEEPIVAFLSFSTKGSASHPMVEKVVKAVQIAREKKPQILIDGEFQADTALAEKVAAKKLKEPSSVAGKANILIFPDLNAGNISYKLTQYLANAEAYGPILQGFAKPVSDLSRGAKVKDIIGVTAITCLEV